MTALLITKTSRNNHTLYTKMYHNGGPLTNTITNKTELYALRDRSLMVIHTPELILSIGCLTPAKGDGGGASSMYNAPQNLLAKIQDKVRTLSEA
jgi:hypothetical protein